MAKRKKKGTTRRRRVSGIGTGLMPVLSVVAGVIAGKMVVKAVGAKLDPKIAAGGQVLLGLFMQKMSNPMFKGLGLGIAANGGASLATTLGIGGIGAVDVIPFRTSGRAHEMSVVNGLGNPQGSPAMQIVNGLGNPQGSPAMSVVNGVGRLSGANVLG